MNLLKDRLNPFAALLREEPEAGTGGTPSPEPKAPEPTPSGDGTPASLIGEGEPPASGDSGNPPAPAAPEPITLEALELGEEFQVEQETMDQFLGLMNNAELSPVDRTKQLLELHQTLLQGQATAAAEAGQAQWTELQTKWQNEARALPEIGGDALPQTLATIKKGLESVGATKEVFEAFDTTGAGNHPQIIATLFALTKNLVEQPPVSGEPPKSAMDKAMVLFGNTQEK